MWTVILYTNENGKCEITKWDTKSDAYEWLNCIGQHAYAIEIFGPNNFHDGVL